MRLNANSLAPSVVKTIIDSSTTEKIMMDG
jgi:hypothetical protein